MFARAILVTSVLAFAGCCLTTVSGGTGDYETARGTGGVSGTTSAGTTGGGSTTGARRATSSGGGFQYCGPPANLSNAASYTSLPLGLMVSADLNGDGLLDLIANKGTYELPSSTGLVVFLSQSDGGLGAPIEYGNTDSIALAVGDVNGDGLPDVVVSNQSALQIYLNDGHGGLTASPAINLEGIPRIDQIAVADFNNDGLADLLVADEALEGGSEVVLLLAQAPAVFGQPSIIPRLGFPAGLLTEAVFLVSDLNQDGLPDIAANTTDAQFEVLLGQGDGGFELALYPTSALGQLVTIPRAGAAPDIAFWVLSQTVEPGGLQILVNSGAGAFSAGPVYQVEGSWLTIGDFNGDCIPDIAADHGGACSPPFGSGVSVLYGDGDGGFVAPVSLQVTEHDAYGMAALGPVSNPRAFAVADACGNGVTVYGDPTKE